MITYVRLCNYKLVAILDIQFLKTYFLGYVAFYVAAALQLPKNTADMCHIGKVGVQYVTRLPREDYYEGKIW